MDPKRIADLLHGFVEGSLSEADRAEFEKLLAENPDLAREIQGQMAVHALLRVRHGGVQAQTQWESVESAIASGADVASEAESPDRGHVVSFPSRRRWLAPALAAAALFLLAVGVLFVVPRPETYPGFQLAKRAGQVSVAGSAVSTGPQSGCRVTLEDGTVVALGENTELDLAPGGAGTTLVQKRGRIYCEVVPQKGPWSVQSGDARVEVLGTKLELDLERTPFVRVFDGRVKVERDRAVLYAGAGQTVRMFPEDKGRRLLSLESGGMAADALAWTRDLGMDPAAAGASARGARVPVGDPQIDFGKYLVVRGSWRVEQRDQDVVLRSESMLDEAHIQFGRARWSRGLLSFKLRVLESVEPKYGVGMDFFDPTHSYYSFTSSRGLKELKEAGHTGWIRMQGRFEVTPDKRVVLRTWDIWPDGVPQAKITSKDWMIETTQEIREVCGIGFSSYGCVVEIAEIKLEEAVEGPAPLDKPVRWSFGQGVPADLELMGGPSRLEPAAGGKPARLVFTGPGRAIPRSFAAPRAPFEVAIKGAVVAQDKALAMTAVRAQGRTIPEYRFWTRTYSYPRGPAEVRHVFAGDRVMMFVGNEVVVLRQYRDASAAQNLILLLENVAVEEIAIRGLTQEEIQRLPDPEKLATSLPKGPFNVAADEIEAVR